jgi:hypothetical protein
MEQCDRSSSIMASTTNYNWSTPDDTALVKDGAAAIRTLGSSIDTTTKALNPSTTLGDIEYRSSTANTNTRLGIGTTGQVLTVAGGVPSWATPAAGGGGKVLQVVNATTSTFTSNSTSTYADVSGLTASITPSSATSKILVLVSANGLYKSAGNADNGVRLRLVRGATSILIIESIVGWTNSLLANTTASSTSYLDSPNTTSSTTYKVQIANYVNTASVGINLELGSVLPNSTITLLEIGA